MQLRNRRQLAEPTKCEHGTSKLATAAAHHDQLRATREMRATQRVSRHVIVSRSGLKTTRRAAASLLDKLFGFVANPTSIKRLVPFAMDNEEAGQSSLLGVLESVISAMRLDSSMIVLIYRQAAMQAYEEYCAAGRLQSIEVATQSGKRVAFLAGTDDESDYAGDLNNLGVYYGVRYKRLGRLEDPEKAVKLYQRAWDFQHAFPFYPLTAVRSCIAVLLSVSRHEETSAIARAAVALLPTLSTRALSRQDRQSILRQFSGLADDACALRLQCFGKDPGAVEEALLVLEAGRGSLLGLALEDRSDMAGLRTTSPQHATRLEDLRAILNANAGLASDTTHRHAQRVSPFQTLQNFNAFLDEIRSLPGFEKFMAGPDVAEMKAGAASGTIVMVNASTDCSDALIITSHAIRLVRLRNFDVTAVREWLA